MKRANWAVVLAGALLTAAGGCSFTDVKGFFWASPAAEAVGDYYVGQSIEEAELMVKVGLDNLGLTAASAPQGNGVVLDSKTRSGSKFRVFLTSDTEGRTRMRIVWVEQKDRDVDVLLIGGLQATFIPAQKK